MLEKGEVEKCNSLSAVGLEVWLSVTLVCPMIRREWICKATPNWLPVSRTDQPEIVTRVAEIKKIIINESH